MNKPIKSVMLFPCFVFILFFYVSITVAKEKVQLPGFSEEPTISNENNKNSQEWDGEKNVPINNSSTKKSEKMSIKTAPDKKISKTESVLSKIKNTKEEIRENKFNKLLMNAQKLKPKRIDISKESRKYVSFEYYNSNLKNHNI